jgi:hypothetical protein
VDYGVEEYGEDEEEYEEEIEEEMGYGYDSGFDHTADITNQHTYIEDAAQHDSVITQEEK